MPASLKLHQALSLLFAVVILQACTCFGIPFDKYFPIFSSGDQPPTATPTPIPAPLPASSVLLPRGMDCAELRLTSPLDGLPNGMAAFYWDALPGAESYRINLYSDSGGYLAGFSAAGDQTNLTADVSWNAIGGQYIIQLEFLAEDSAGNECRQTFTLFREAPVIPDVPVSEPQPTATPTCRENPDAPYC